MSPTWPELAALGLAHCIILGIAWLRYRWVPHRRRQQGLAEERGVRR